MKRSRSSHVGFVRIDVHVVEVQLDQDLDGRERSARMARTGGAGHLDNFTPDLPGLGLQFVKRFGHAVLASLAPETRRLGGGDVAGPPFSHGLSGRLFRGLASASIGLLGSAAWSGAFEALRMGMPRRGGGGRIELMPKTNKGVRPRRSSAFRNLDVRIAGGSLGMAGLVPRKTADPEELTKAVTRATEVLGDEDAALRWLGTPVAALDYATPVSILGTPQGVTRVNDVLTQLEHGVW